MPEGRTGSAVTYELRGAVALIGLAREDRRNAISDRVLADLQGAISQARHEAKAAVLFGHGEHFCAGLDLLELKDKNTFEMLAASRNWGEVFGQIEFGPIPWFCALHGAVVGGGLELAASTHVRIADETAFFALPEGERGIFVGGGGSVRVARLIGVARMTDLMLTGRTVAHDEVPGWNLAQYVVPAGQALTKAISLAERAAGNAPMSNYAVINALPRISQMSRDDGLFAESVVAALTASAPEAKARLAEFAAGKGAKIAIRERSQA